MKFPEHVEKILQTRYYLTGEMYKKYYGTDGQEDWEMLCKRVCMYVANGNIDLYNEFYDVLYNREFIPNSPTLFGAGIPGLCLSACFVIPVEDSIEGWMESYRIATKVQTHGGGCGFPLHKIRPAGMEITGKRAKSAGPVAFMKNWNQISQSFSQGPRSGANMGQMKIDHPSIEEFIDSKTKDGELSAFNISVMPTDEFMKAVETNSTFDLKWEGVVFKTIKAKELWNRIIKNAWLNGDPGITFWDNVQKAKNPIIDGDLYGNPCNEFNGVPLSACNLGSINLKACIDPDTKKFNFDKLNRITRTAYRFLNAVINVNHYPDPKIDEVVKKYRQIGIGVMGLHDVFLVHGMRYGNEHSIHITEQIFSNIKKTADSMNSENNNQNANVLSVAPTGCQVASTMITTENGLYYLDEIGDINGSTWQEINHVAIQESTNEPITKFFVNGKQKTKKITCDSGNILECTYNHQYRVLDNDNYIWKRADELKPGDKLVIKIGGYNNKNEVKLERILPRNRKNKSNFIQPSFTNPDLGRFLGLYFGNGSTHNKGIRLHFNHEHTVKIEMCRDLIKSIFNIDTILRKEHTCSTIYVNSQNLLKWLEINGFLKNKSTNAYIPFKIRTSSKSTLFNFIKGIYIADGSHTGQTKYIDTSSKRLADELLVSLRSIGINVRVKTNLHISGRISDKPSYRVYMKKFGSVGYNVPYEQIKLNVELKNDIKRIRMIDDSLFIDKVVKIDESSANTYDIEVPNNNTYLANNTISHNTISMIAECSSGIEPYFSFDKIKRIINGKAEMIDPPYKTGNQNIDVGANDLTIDDHIAITAMAQRFVDMSISKTINLKNTATVEDVDYAYMQSWKHGLKGVTVYRDGSRANQTIQTEKSYSMPTESQLDSIKPIRCDGSLAGRRFKDKIGCGNIYSIINHDDNKDLVEVFIKPGKSGGCHSNVEALGRIITLALRCGVKVSEIVKQLKGIRCPSCIANKSEIRYLSCPDAIGKAIEYKYNKLKKKLPETKLKLPNGMTLEQLSKIEDRQLEKLYCPECKEKLIHESGCIRCVCGYSKCG